MNCINCFHYKACSSIDVTGYVADIEREDGDCEHFITPEEVHPVAEVVECVNDYGYNDIFLHIHCSNCGEDLNLKSYRREDWNSYFKDKHYIEYKKRYCPGCGAIIVKEKENV